MLIDSANSKQEGERYCIKKYGCYQNRRYFAFFIFLKILNINMVGIFKMRIFTIFDEHKCINMLKSESENIRYSFK